MPSNFSRTKLYSSKIDTAIETKRKAANVAQRVGGVLSKLGRFAMSAFSNVVQFFNIDFSTIWDICVQGYFALKEFDWNSTDKEIEGMIQRNNQALLNRAATAAGETLGFGAVRVAALFGGRRNPAANVKVPVLSARVGLALAEEAQDEAAANVRNLMGAVAGAVAGNMALNALLWARRNEILGQKSITDENLPNGSISEKIDSKIEKLPQMWRQPAENFIEGIEDGISSAGYVVATTIDDHVAAQWWSEAASPMRTVEVEATDGTKVIVTAPQAALPAAIASSLSMGAAIGDRDVGQFLGEPFDPNVKPLPSDRFLKIVWRSEKPTNKEKRQYAIATTTIPRAKAGITDKDLATIPAFTHGPTRVSCLTESGRQVAIYASTAAEGKKLLEGLIGKFSSDKVREGSWKDSKVNSRSGKIKTNKVLPKTGTYLDGTKNSSRSFRMTRLSVAAAMP